MNLKKFIIFILWGMARPWALDHKKKPLYILYATDYEIQWNHLMNISFPANKCPLQGMLLTKKSSPSDIEFKYMFLVMWLFWWLCTNLYVQLIRYHYLLTIITTILFNIAQGHTSAKELFFANYMLIIAESARWEIFWGARLTETLSAGNNTSCVGPGIWK